MLKYILHHSPKLACLAGRQVTFIMALKLALRQPQLNHVTRVADAIIVCESRKTLSNLYRQFVEAPDLPAAGRRARRYYISGAFEPVLRRFLSQEALALS